MVQHIVSPSFFYSIGQREIRDAHFILLFFPENDTDHIVVFAMLLQTNSLVCIIPVYRIVTSTRGKVIMRDRLCPPELSLVLDTWSWKRRITKTILTKGVF